MFHTHLLTLCTLTLCFASSCSSPKQTPEESAKIGDAIVQSVLPVYKQHYEKNPVGNPTAEDRELLRACYIGGLESARYAIESGADVNCVGIDGSTPLGAASFSASTDLMEYLISKGADPNNNAGRSTALMKAIVSQWPDKVELLLNHGANPNLCSRSGDSPLQYAAQLKSPAILKILLRAGADPDGSNGDPIKAAYSKKQKENMSILLSHGADIDLLAPKIWSIEDMRFYFSHNGNVNKLGSHIGTIEELKLYLDRGGDVANVTGSGAHDFADDLKAAKYFVENGGDINNPGSSIGWSLLHCAAVEGKVEVVLYLLDHGANPRARTNDGETPYDLAKHVDGYDDLAKQDNKAKVMRILENIKKPRP